MVGTEQVVTVHWGPIGRRERQENTTEEVIRSVFPRTVSTLSSIEIHGRADQVHGDQHPANPFSKRPGFPLEGTNHHRKEQPPGHMNLQIQHKNEEQPTNTYPGTLGLETPDSVPENQLEKVDKRVDLENVRKKPGATEQSGQLLPSRRL